MSAGTTEQREDSDDVIRDGNHARAGIRCLTDDPLAGGPIEVEFLVEALGESHLHLAIGGDRSRQRPGQFEFSATLEGTEIADPMAGIADLGGPLGVVDITADHPWRQPLIINQFLRLEETAQLLDDGKSGRLDLTCHRPLALSSTASGALRSGKSSAVTFSLSFLVRRDDSDLRNLVMGLLDDVMRGDAAARERPLALLLSLRSVARDQITELMRHSDPAVAGRALHVLDAMT